MGRARNLLAWAFSSSASSEVFISAPPRLLDRIAERRLVEKVGEAATVKGLSSALTLAPGRTLKGEGEGAGRVAVRHGAQLLYLVFFLGWISRSFGTNNLKETTARKLKGNATLRASLGSLYVPGISHLQTRCDNGGDKQQIYCAPKFRLDF